MIDGLTFQAEGHVYRYGGTRVPSVTQVLTPFHDFGMVDRDVLAAACEFGTNVHAAVHLFNQEELDEESLAPPLVPYLDAYKAFLRVTGFKVEQSEIRVYHKVMRYAGQIDFAGTWQGTSWVVDIKSGVLPSTVGLQLAAYQAAMPIRPRNRLCLQLSETGYKLHRCTKTTDFNDFTSTLNFHRLLEKHNPRSLNNGYANLYPN